jgi:antagonist of KipI
VPADGQPIVLMADRQTTGGYARIATVISTDLGALAQARPGKSVRFREVSVDEAQETAVRRENLLATLQEGCGVGR